MNREMDEFLNFILVDCVFGCIFIQFIKIPFDTKLISNGCSLYGSCIKEGSTVSVMGMVSRHESVLMIVPPTEPISTGCQWTHCLLPTYTEGLVLTCDESQTADVIPV